MFVHVSYFAIVVVRIPAAINFGMQRTTSSSQSDVRRFRQTYRAATSPPTAAHDPSVASSGFVQCGRLESSPGYLRNAVQRTPKATACPKRHIARISSVLSPRFTATISASAVACESDPQCRVYTPLSGKLETGPLSVMWIPDVKRCGSGQPPRSASVQRLDVMCFASPPKPTD